MAESSTTPDPDPAGGHDRRTFLSRASSAVMGVGLFSGYGAFGAVAGRFLYPSGDSIATGWVFVTDVNRLQPGEAMLFTTPTGATVTLARRAGEGSAEDFIALSSTCPHLGCQVRWEGQHNRFFCPCHNGTFDPEGRGTGGPPGDAGQSLPRYPLRLEHGLIFLEVSLELPARPDGGNRRA